MKKMIMLLAMSMLISAGAAFAAPYIPPAGPLFIQYSNMEQISVSPTGNSGPYNESNWGVFVVSSIAKGGAVPANQNFNPTGPALFSNLGVNNGQITGIFEGFKFNNNGAGGTSLNSTGGSIYLYFDDSTLANTLADTSTATPAQRTSQTTFTNFTDGVLLAKLDFVNGAIVPGDPTTSVTGTALPTASGFTGFADSYANVDLSAGGLWATILDSNFFNTLLGPNTADLKFRSVYSGPDSAWNGTDWLGADSTDPARADAVPEPSTMLLLGAGLCGIIALKRRQSKK